MATFQIDFEKWFVGSARKFKFFVFSSTLAFFLMFVVFMAPTVT